MVMTRVSGSRNLRFDRVIPGVGRLQGSSGTSKRGEFAYRNGLLTKLVQAGALDILREFKAQRLTMNDLIAADREHRLLQLAGEMKLERSLAVAIAAWLPISAPEPISRRRYQCSWDRLRRKVPALERATVRDLEKLDWRSLFRVWGASGSDWNRMRAMISAFLTHVTGHRHTPFRLAVVNKDRFPRGRESVGRVPDVSAEQFWQIVKLTPAYVQPTIVAFAALGCGHKEFDGIQPEDVNDLKREVRLVSRKGPDRDRVVVVAESLWPWVSRAIQCSVQRKWRLIHFKRAARKVAHTGERPADCACAMCSLTLYDLRHLGAQLAADEGVHLRDIMGHLGHSNPKQTIRYARRRSAAAVGEAIGAALKERA